MKPTLKFAWLLLVAGTAATISAQTVDEIIAKNLEARGGLDKIQAVKTMRETGRLTQGDLRVRFIQENLRPNHVRQEIVVQGMSQIDAYDGHVGWRVSPFAGRKDPDLLSADDMKNLVIAADVDGELVDYRNKDHRAEYLGHDSVEGTDCYKIKLTLSSGDVRIFYIDTVSNLEIKIESQIKVRGTVQYTETYLGDYEKVAGVYFPFSMEVGEKGSPDRTKFTLDQVQVNVPMEATRFSVPVVVAK